MAVKMYKTELERLTDPEYGKRKLDHYNAWLLDPNRDPSSRYGGFPEDIERECAIAEMRRDMTERGLLKPTERKPKQPKPKVARQPRTGPSKIDRAVELYRANANRSRVNMVAIFERELEMSPAGATTYYYNVMKKVGHA